MWVLWTASMRTAAGGSCLLVGNARHGKGHGDYMKVAIAEGFCSD